MLLNMFVFLPVSQQGDLGAIDEKYDVAISSSCGSLDNILVDTIETAQKCVTFLKAQNIGVATFIGLDKVRELICGSVLLLLNLMTKVCRSLLWSM